MLTDSLKTSSSSQSAGTSLEGRHQLLLSDGHGHFLRNVVTVAQSHLKLGPTRPKHFFTP